MNFYRLKKKEIKTKIRGERRSVGQYLSIFSEKHKVLKLFRINSDKNNLIAEIPVLSIVNCMMVNNKYVILGTNDKRILSYLIVDYKNKMHDNRIKELTLQ